MSTPEDTTTQAPVMIDLASLAALGHKQQVEVAEPLLTVTEAASELAELPTPTEVDPAEGEFVPAIQQQYGEPEDKPLFESHTQIVMMLSTASVIYGIFAKQLGWPVPELSNVELGAVAVVLFNLYIQYRRLLPQKPIRKGKILRKLVPKKAQVQP